MILRKKDSLQRGESIFIITRCDTSSLPSLLQLKAARLQLHLYFTVVIVVAIMLARRLLFFWEKLSYHRCRFCEGMWK